MFFSSYQAKENLWDMADVAISFAVEKLGNLLSEKAVFLKGIEEQVSRLKDELKRMQYFLKDVAEKQTND